MPKIDNTSIREIKNCDTLRVFRYENSKNYYVSFYVSKSYSSNFMHIKSLRVKDYKVAIKLAKEIYRSFDKESFKKIEKQISFHNDIAVPFFKSRLKKYIAKDKPQYAKKEENRYLNYMRHHFDDVDYRNNEYVENAIEELHIELKERKIKDTTISKYFNILNQMFNRAFKNSILPVIPELPSTKRINEERPMYFPREMKQIINAFKEEYLNTEDPFYDEVADLIQFCRSSGVRPGLEPLRIKRFQTRFINDPDNPSVPVLTFQLKTKTKPSHTISMHPDFTHNIYPRMMSRYSEDNINAEDYVFFPLEKNRDKLYQRISKNFTRISQNEKLYYLNDKERPFYSIRHSFITNRINKDVPIQLVADASSTSSAVIQSNYLEHDETTILNQHKRLFADKYASSTRSKK